MIDGYNVFFLKNLFPVSPPSHGFSDIQKKSTTKSIKTVKNSFGCRGRGERAAVKVSVGVICMGRLGSPTQGQSIIKKMQSGI